MNFQSICCRFGQCHNLLPKGPNIIKARTSKHKNLFGSNTNPKTSNSLGRLRIYLFALELVVTLLGGSFVSSLPKFTVGFGGVIIDDKAYRLGGLISNCAALVDEFFGI